VVAAIAALGMATACGSDDESSSSAAIVIETTDPSPDEVSVQAPETVPAGLVKIELRNAGDTLHDAQLFRVDGDQTANDVASVLEASDAEPWPRWLRAAGGVAPVAPDGRASVDQVLAPGKYYVADTQERADPSGARVTNAAKDGIAKIEVTGGDGDSALPSTPATITAREYGFDTTGIVAGRNRVTFRNAGREFHQVVAFPIPDDVSFKAGKEAVLGEQATTGWVPVDVPHDRATAVLEGRGEQVTELTFQEGRHLLLCFVSDRAGGGAQWTLGMASRLDVAPD
jgi:hypothetical protein